MRHGWDKKRLQDAEMKVLRRVVGATRLRNEDIRERLKQEAVVAQVKRREAWRDKVTENEGSLMNKLQERDPEGRPEHRVVKTGNR